MFAWESINGAGALTNDDMVVFTWDSDVQVSAEHVAMLAAAYEAGRRSVGGADEPQLKKWKKRVADSAYDLLGVTDEIPGGDL